MASVGIDVIGKGMNAADNSVSNTELVAVNAEIRNHPIEKVGSRLRAYMTSMKPLAE